MKVNDSRPVRALSCRTSDPSVQAGLGEAQQPPAHTLSPLMDSGLRLQLPELLLCFQCAAAVAGSSCDIVQTPPLLLPRSPAPLLLPTLSLGGFQACGSAHVH